MSNSWSLGAPTSTLHGVLFAWTKLATGQVLIAGGQANGGPVVDVAEVYNPLTNAWSQYTMPESRVYDNATVMTSGGVLISGGYGAGFAVPSTSLLFTP